jgi:CubicO group peptidase (beta-lactamase class C family)
MKKAKPNEAGAVMRAHSHTPSVSVAVIRDGTVVTRGYGQAAVELAVPATVDTVYELASVTKRRPAMASAGP